MANIFLKTCPECACAISITATFCACGYTFPSHEPQPGASQEDIAQEEALYEEYLSARAEQAVEAARVAKHLSELFPDDAQKALESEKLQLAAQVAEAELASQRERVAQLIDALKSGTGVASQAA
jgi:hypothetical protein